MKRHRSEDAIQSAVFQRIRLHSVRSPVAVDVPNGSVGRIAEVQISNGLGVTPGLPDLLAWHDNRARALELKVESDRLNEAQAEMLERLDRAGVICSVAHGLDRALAVLKACGLFKGEVQ